MSQPIVENTQYFISPALWEEPRCYWHTGQPGEKVTLQELPSISRAAHRWEFVKDGNTGFFKIKGKQGFLRADRGKLQVLTTLEEAKATLIGFSLKQVGAYYTIAQRQNPLSLLQCEDGNLGRSTDIQINAHSVSSSGWTDWSKVPGDAFPYLWKIDRADVKPRSWMSSLSETDKDKKLNQLAICGTHDTCTWKFSSANYSRTQDLTVLEQLKIGIRYLDIRVGPDFETYHGAANGVSFEDVLKDIADFFALTGSQNETIIMAINGGDGKQAFADDMRLVVQSQPVTGEGKTSVRTTLTWYSENRVPTLREVTGKVVLLRRYEDAHSDAPGINLRDWGTEHDNDTFTADGVRDVDGIVIQDEYKLVQNSTKKGWIKKTLNDMTSKTKTSKNWYLNFTNAGSGQRPSTYSNDINPWLGANLNFERFVNGTIVMDYPSPAIVERIISFNF